MRALQRKLALAESPSDAFIDDLLAFRAFGRSTETFVDGGILYFVNEYWTARQRQSHALHEVSYRACFKAELPRFFIERLTAPGDLVYDPFMGRGTTLLEAALMGRRVAGNDINPLSRVLIAPRLAPPPLAAIAGMACFAQRYTPRTFTAMRASQACSSVSTTVPAMP